MSKAILVTSGNGGAGKTTFAVNIACELAELGHKTLLLDFNIGLRNADIYTGLENSVVFDLGDVFSGVCNIDKAIVKDYSNPNFYLLCCPQNKDIVDLTEGHVDTLYKYLRTVFEYIVVDMPFSQSDLFTAVAKNIDSTLIVFNPDYLSVRSADAVDRRLESFGVKERLTVLNKVDQSVWGNEDVPTLSFIAKELRAPLVGIQQVDNLIHLANCRGIPCVYDAGAASIKVFMTVAEAFL